MFKINLTRLKKKLLSIIQKSRQTFLDDLENKLKKFARRSRKIFKRIIDNLQDDYESIQN